MGMTSALNKWNLKVVKNRWAREGVFILLTPVAGLTGMIDLLVLNSVEFWTGTNPYTKKSPAVVDMAAADLEQAGVKNVAAAKIRFDGKDTVKMEVVYNDGHEEMISAIRKDNTFDFYQDGILVGSVTQEELDTYAQLKKS